MFLFVLAAGMMTVILLKGASERPRPALFVAAVLWLLYAVYEYHIMTGVLCDKDCNIRVDLVLFFPILALATFYAYRAYIGQPASLMVLGIVLGVIGLFVAGLFAEQYVGGFALAGILAVLAIGACIWKSKSSTNKSATDQP